MKNHQNIISLNKDAWDKVAKMYEKENVAKISPLFHYFCNQLPKGSFILDLGSGTGVPYSKMFIEKGFRVLGIDISSQMINIAKKNVPRAEFIELSMTDLNFKNKFEGIFSSFTMLLLDPLSFKDVGSRIVQSLKKEGLFYLSLNEPWEENADVDGEAIVEIMGEKMYSRAYTKDEVFETFTPLGMRLLKFNREIQTSKIFGIEHTTTYIFQKV